MSLAVQGFSPKTDAFWSMAELLSNAL